MLLPDYDGDEGADNSDDSDLRSKKTFSYWGSDKITFQKPVTTRPRQIIPVQNGVRRGPTPSNTRFGTRLLSTEPLAAPPRPSSRRTCAVTPIRQPLTDTTTVVKSAVTRPAWSEDSTVDLQPGTKAPEEYLGAERSCHS